MLRLQRGAARVRGRHGEARAGARLGATAQPLRRRRRGRSLDGGRASESVPRARRASNHETWSGPRPPPATSSSQGPPRRGDRGLRGADRSRAACSAATLMPTSAKQDGVGAAAVQHGVRGGRRSVWPAPSNPSARTASTVARAVCSRPPTLAPRHRPGRRSAPWCGSSGLRLSTSRIDCLCVRGQLGNGDLLMHPVDRQRLRETVVVWVQEDKSRSVYASDLAEALTPVTPQTGKRKVKVQQLLSPASGDAALPKSQALVFGPYPAAPREHSPRPRGHAGSSSAVSPSGKAASARSTTAADADRRLHTSSSVGRPAHVPAGQSEALVARTIENAKGQRAIAANPRPVADARAGVRAWSAVAPNGQDH